MAGPTRRSAFASHRGAAAKRLIIGVIAGAFLLMIISNMLQGEDTAPTASNTASVDPTSEPTDVKAPDVVPAVADPMNPYRGVNAGVETSGTPEAPVDPAVFQDMLTTAQETSVAFGSYSYQEDPQEWAKKLPNLSASLRERLTETAEKTWPSLAKSKVVARTTLTGQSPQIVYYRDTEGEAQVVVLTTQQVSGVNGQVETGKSYAVTLRYMKKDKAWVVTGLVTG